MQLLSEFRYPKLWYFKLVAGILAIVFFGVMAAAIISGYIVYNIIVIPPGNPEAINLTSFPGQPEDVTYNAAGLARHGWFFPGLKSAPTILLCPGYRGSRGELLPLATALQDHEYNVFLFNFDSRATGSGYSTLGFHEVDELRGAVAEIARRQDVDATRFGVWGTNMGGYAAVAVAESDPRVRALAVESIYDRPQQMVELLAARSGLASFPVLRDFAVKSFMLLNYRYVRTPPLSAGLARLTGAAKLFLEAADEPGLVEATHQLFVLAPEPKQEDMLPLGNYAGMLDEQKRIYENRIVSFFLVNLPPEVRDTAHPRVE